MKKPLYVLIAIGLVALLFLPAGQPVSAGKRPPPAADPSVELGKALFLDANLSANANQSCATCHAPEVGFTGPDSLVNATTVVYPGSLPDRFGNRKPPAAAYAGDSPALQQNADGVWFGGMFWDGRADGTSSLHDPLAEQAKGPFLNPAEQALATEEELCAKVAASSYAGLYTQAWGTLDCGSAGAVYDNIGMSIAAYERSSEVNPFNSKFDAFWDRATARGRDVTAIVSGNWQTYRKLGLTDAELQGLAFFNDPARANCASCHTLTPGPQGRPLFTDFTYDNLGIPRNPDNPASKADQNWVDLGLGVTVNDPAQYGKFKVPTLRNVDKRPSTGTVKAYAHNGYFKSLDDIVFFYHWRAMMDSGMGGGGMGGAGMMSGRYPPPEVDANRTLLQRFPGMDVPYIVAFLKTLSDQ